VFVCWAKVGNAKVIASPTRASNRIFINESLRLFEIVTGDNDFMTGREDHQFEINLVSVR